MDFWGSEKGSPREGINKNRKYKWNSVFEHCFGYSPTEITGKHASGNIQDTFSIMGQDKDVSQDKDHESGNHLNWRREYFGRKVKNTRLKTKLGIYGHLVGKRGSQISCLSFAYQTILHFSATFQLEVTKQFDLASEMWTALMCVTFEWKL